MASVLLLLIVSTISYWWGEHRLQRRFADIVVEAPLVGKTRLILPDSTLVWLNAGSKISYSQGFGVKDRHLQLNGEGYFEVRKDVKLPFDVKTRKLNVTVLGTKFNFRNLTLKASNITVKHAMDELKSRSGYSFVFSSKDVDTERKVSVLVENQY